MRKSKKIQAFMMALLMIFSAIAPNVIGIMNCENIVHAAYIEKSDYDGIVPSSDVQTQFDGQTMHKGESKYNGIDFGNGIGIPWSGSYNYRDSERIIRYGVKENDKGFYDELKAIKPGYTITDNSVSLDSNSIETTTHKCENSTHGVATHSITWFPVTLANTATLIAKVASTKTIYMHCNDPGLNPPPEFGTVTLTALGYQTHDYEDDNQNIVHTIVVYFKMYGATTHSNTQNGILYLAMAAAYIEETPQGQVGVRKQLSTNVANDANYYGTATFGMYDNASCSGIPIATTNVAINKAGECIGTFPGKYDEGNQYWIKEMSYNTSNSQYQDKVTLDNTIQSVTITKDIINYPAYTWVNNGVNEMQLGIVKSSRYPDITDGNNCYSLAGAVYSVFPTEAQARAAVLSCLSPKGNRITTGAVASFTIDEHGNSNLLKSKTNDLDFSKTYYIVETTAPKGYRFGNVYWSINLNLFNNKILNRMRYQDNNTWITTESSFNTTQSADGVTTIILPLTDAPFDDPVTIFLQKNDADLQETLQDYDVSDLADANLAQGNGYLANAVYELNYYDNLNATNDNVGDYSGTPKYTWYFRTDANGRCSINGYSPKREWNDNTHRFEFVYVNGNIQYETVGVDDYYLPTFNGKSSSPLLNIIPVSGKNIARWPIGTYTLHEVQAPEDYLVSDVLYKFAVVEDINNAATGVSVVGDVEKSNGITWISTTNDAGERVLEAEQVRRYSFRFQKLDWDTAAYNSQGNAHLPTRYVVMNNSDRSIIYDVNNDNTYSKETEKIASIKNTEWTDEKIKAEIKKYNENSIENIEIDVNNDGINDVLKVITLDSNGYGRVDN